MSDKIPVKKLELLRDLSQKDSVWDKHKGDAVKLAKMFLDDKSGDPILEKYAERLIETAQNLGFKWQVDESTGEAKIKLSSAWFSRWRHDPVSNWRKSMKWRSIWFNALPNVFEAHPTHRWLFLTLTVENCKITDLNATCKHLNKSFLKLIRGKRLAKYFYSRDKSVPIAGYYRAMEITKEKERDGYAHPHLHVLLHLPPSYFKGENYIPQKEWAELWRTAAGLDYDPVIDIRAVKPKKAKLDDKFGGLFDAILEVTKYPMKMADLLVNADWTKEYIKQMHRVRLTDVGGTLKRFIAELDDDDKTDLIHIDEDGKNTEKIDDSKGDIFFEFDYRKTVRKYVKK